MLSHLACVIESSQIIYTFMLSVLHLTAWSPLIRKPPVCGPEAGSHSSLFRNLKLLRVLSQHHGSSILQASLWEPPVTHCPLLVPAHRGVPSSSHLSALSLQFFPCSPFQPFVLLQHLCYSAVSHPAPTPIPFLFSSPRDPCSF